MRAFLIAEVGAVDEASRCAVAGSLPAWGDDRRLPGGAPHRQGRAEPVAGGDLMADGRMADGLRRLAEARPLGAAIRVRVGGTGSTCKPGWKKLPLRSCVECTFSSWDACAYETPRSMSAAQQSLNSRVNLRLSMTHLRSHKNT
jgi:hypothetical protein